MDERRITFLLPSYAWFPIGGFKVVFEYANYLARRGWIVTILFPRRLDVTQGVLEKYRRLLWLLNVRLRKWRLVSWFELDARVRVKLITRWSHEAVPDGQVVFATGWQTAGPVAALPASKGAKFYLVQHHETWSGPESEVNETFRMPFTIIVISRWLENIVRQAGAHRVVVISNGLDHTHFKESRVGRNPRSLLTLNHASAFKGVPDALAAITRIHAEEPDVEVKMFGIPERGSNIPEWITYVRSPSPRELAALYNWTGIYVSASVVEGWALPPAEAMACGGLFVGTDSGGCRDYADSEVTALLSAPNDPEALYRNLKRALAGGPEIEAIRRRGAEHIRTFTWDVSGKKLIDEMTAVLGAI